MNRLIQARHAIASLCCGMALLAWPDTAGAQTGENRFTPWEECATPQEGMNWPQGQALPHMACPDTVLDGLYVADKNLTDTERTLFSALQGVVNRTKPRIFLFEPEQEGKYKWPGLLGLEIDEWPADKRWELVRKYKDEVTGVVLYSTERSRHYKNLASTVAGLKGALPVTQAERQALEQAGMHFEVVDDLSGLPYDKPTEIYQYLYEHYWPLCSKRLLVSLNPDMGYVRDLGVAAGAAIIWLDPRKSPENTVVRKFLQQMEAGESVVTGWWPEERAGIGVATEYGLSTIPSDFYENATVYAGMSHQTNPPAVPKKPRLENKVYLAIFLSDGDNVQYCQHAMSRLWDQKNRGIIPLNWTISPALADIGPGLMNHYYRTATPNDCFVSGPSGMGYAMMYDAHNYVWNAAGRAAFEPYARLTSRYLEKTGLRVITIWDEVDTTLAETYADHCRNLYGLTLQDWERHSHKLRPFTARDRLPVVPNLPCYVEDVNTIYDFWQDTIARFDGTHPLFLAAQGKSWNLGPDQIVRLKERLEQLSPGNIVICRADHFFNLYNEAHGMDHNLTLAADVRITSSRTSTKPGYAADGTASEGHQWISEGQEDNSWIQFDLKEEYLISRYVVRHAGAAGMDCRLNTRNFRLDTSSDGRHWTTADCQTANACSVTDTDISPVKARYVRLTVTHPGTDGTARIGDVEIYGRK